MDVPQGGYGDHRPGGIGYPVGGDGGSGMALDYGRCRTIHASQGQTVDHVVVAGEAGSDGPWPSIPTTGRSSGRAGPAGRSAMGGDPDPCSATLGSAGRLAGTDRLRAGRVSGRLQPTRELLQQPDHRRPQYGGGLVDSIQLGHGLADVKIDRALRDVEDVSDFAGGLALTGPAQHFYFSAG